MGMIVLLAKLNGNLFKYDTLQENSFKEKAQQAVYHFLRGISSYCLLKHWGNKG